MVRARLAMLINTSRQVLHFLGHSLSYNSAEDDQIVQFISGILGFAGRLALGLVSLNYFQLGGRRVLNLGQTPVKSSSLITQVRLVPGRLLPIS